MPIGSILVIGIKRHKNGVPKIIVGDIFLIRTKDVDKHMPWLQIRVSGILYLIYIELPLADVCRLGQLG